MLITSSKPLYQHGIFADDIIGMIYEMKNGIPSFDDPPAP